MLVLAGLIATTPALAQVRAVPAQPESEQAALRGVEVFLLNETATPVSDAGPRQLEVTAADGSRLVLERAPGPTRTIAPRAFAKVRYIPVSVASVVVPPSGQHPAATLPDGETVVQSSTGSSSAFADRFEPHEPVYGAFGFGDSGAKLQLSLGFRPFAEDAPAKLGNLRFAYTQTMFWAIEEPSGPFRSTIYSPEVYADSALDDTTRVAIGWRHDSNGRGDPDSVDLNRIFARVEKQFDLGGDWRLDVAPMAWFYVGPQRAAQDVPDYYGYTSLSASIQQKDGFKLSLTGRGNVETGKASAELFASYPLARLGGGIGFYLFGQAFAGHAETLDDYRRSDTHARIGIALTR